MSSALSSTQSVGSALRPNYLSTIENVAQSVGTMGPAATLGTVVPLLIGKAGNGTWLLFLGIVCVFLLISVNINAFASRFASAGGLSSYAESGLGFWPGILTGWSYVVAMTFVVTSSAVASAYYLGMVVAHFTDRAVGRPWSVLMIIMIVLLAWLPANRDIKLSTKVMLVTEAISVGVIVLILGIAMWQTPHAVDHAQLHLAGAHFSQIKTGLVLAFMMMAGFESATTLGEEAQSATHTIPRVLIFCLLPVGALFMASIYAVTTLSHDRTLGFDPTSAPLDLIARSIHLPALGWMSSIGVAVSCFGCALGGFNAGARVIFSMARKRFFVPFFATVHPKNGTPSRALSVIAAVACLVSGALIMAGVTMAAAMDYLMQIASFGFLGGYLAICVAAPFYLGRRHLLTVSQLLVAITTLLVIGGVLFLSLFPVPDAPWRYLPYAFATLLSLGTGSTAYVYFATRRSDRSRERSQRSN